MTDSEKETPGRTLSPRQQGCLSCSFLFRRNIRQNSGFSDFQMSLRRGVMESFSAYRNNFHHKYINVSAQFSVMDDFSVHVGFHIVLKRSESDGCWEGNPSENVQNDLENVRRWFRSDRTDPHRTTESQMLMLWRQGSGRVLMCSLKVWRILWRDGLYECVFLWFWSRSENDLKPAQTVGRNRT